MSEENAIAVRQEQNVVLMEFTPQQVAHQVALIQQIMRDVMHKDEHYGIIPGCGEKPTLLKAGAEKLSLTFRMAPDYEVETVEMGRDHKEYRVKCKMTHIGTGSFLGAGVGCASTKETKWRFRKTTTPTGEPIPKDYKENKGAYTAKGFACRKNDAGEWEWCKIERIEHDNPADNYNTCLKMGKKRALVDAVLTCTAASDIFTQDLEEMRENGLVVSADQLPQAGTHPPITEPKAVAPSQAQAKPTPPPTKPTPPPPTRPAPELPTIAPSAMSDYEVLVTLGPVNYKDGVKKNGVKWELWSAKGDDGKLYSTFNSALGAAMKEVAGRPAIISWQESNRADCPTVTAVALPAATDTRGNADEEPREDNDGNEPLPYLACTQEP